MGEPSENPRKNKNEELTVLIDRIDLFKIWIFFSDDLVHNFAHGHPDLAKLKGEKVKEISPTCSFHEIVSSTVPKQN